MIAMRIASDTAALLRVHAFARDQLYDRIAELLDDPFRSLPYRLSDAAGRPFPAAPIASFG